MPSTTIFENRGKRQEDIRRSAATGKTKKSAEFTINEFGENVQKTTVRTVVSIHGRKYDVTNFDHPGGKKLFDVGAEHGIDLGDRFDSIGHSIEARKQMAKMRIKEDDEEYTKEAPVSESEEQYRLPHQDEEFFPPTSNPNKGNKTVSAKATSSNVNSDIYKRCEKYLKANGAWKRDMLQEVFTLLIPLFIFLLAALVLHKGEAPVTAAIILSVAHTLSGWKGHDVSHEPWYRNTWMREIYPTLLGGFSSRWWSPKHNAYHHCYPNMVDVDQDFDTSPILMHEESTNWFHRLQHIYHVLPFSFLKWSWRLQSLPSASTVELLSILLHYVILHLIYGPWVSIASIFIDGEVTAMITTLNHDAEEKSLTPGNFLIATLKSTIDIDVPYGLGWIFGNMQYQTLHHLFPYIPSYHYSKLQPLIIKFCEENNLNYRVVKMSKAYWDHKVYYYNVVRQPVIGTIQVKKLQ